MKIIGISGTNGAGKDSIAEMLVEKHGFLFVGATEMFLDELKKRGWPTDREHKAALSADWRREFGMAVIVDKAVAAFEADPGSYQGLVVSSLRHPGEADRVHELGGEVWWVDADPKVRYERIQRAKRDGRGLEDNKTFEEFITEEQREMTPVGDAATLNTAAIKPLADKILYNEGSDLIQLAKDVETALGA